MGCTGSKTTQGSKPAIPLSPTGATLLANPDVKTVKREELEVSATGAAGKNVVEEESTGLPQDATAEEAKAAENAAPADANTGKAEAEPDQELEPAEAAAVADQGQGHGNGRGHGHSHGHSHSHSHGSGHVQDQLASRQESPTVSKAATTGAVVEDNVMLEHVQDVLLRVERRVINCLC